VTGALHMVFSFALREAVQGANGLFVSSMWGALNQVGLSAAAPQSRGFRPLQDTSNGGLR